MKYEWTILLCILYKGICVLSCYIFIEIYRLYTHTFPFIDGYIITRIFKVICTYVEFKFYFTQL